MPAGSAAPTLIRSSSPVVWVHWSSDATVEAEGFTARYKTDLSHNTKLSSLQLRFPANQGGQALATVPIFNALQSHTYFAAQLPEQKTQVEVTAVPADTPAWTPWQVTHPASSQNALIEPVSITVNGLDYVPGHLVQFEMDILETPIVVGVRAMDQYTLLDYVINVSPNMRDQGEEKIVSNTTATLIQAARKPPAWEVQINPSSGWRPANVYSEDVVVFEGDMLVYSMHDTLDANGVSITSVLMLMDQAGCPTPYTGVAINPCSGAGCLLSNTAPGQTIPNFKLEMDEVGTFFFAGSQQACTTYGQHATVHVRPTLGLAPNSPDTAKNLTHPRIFGANLTGTDRPWITGTQWDAVPVTSRAGWNGFHEWFRFDAHTNERFSTNVVPHKGVYYAAATVWDADYNLLVGNVSTPCTQLPCAGPRGSRELQLDWAAPATGSFYLAIRTYVVDGFRYGNYTVTSQSDWVDLCQAQGLQCGPFGNCEVIEGPPGRFRPVCVCIKRWQGERCEIEAAAPLVLVISASTALTGGGTSPAIIRQALVTAVPGVENAMVEISKFSQRMTASINLPGQIDDYNSTTSHGVHARKQIVNALAAVFSKQLQGCTGSRCGVRITNISDYFAAHGMRVTSSATNVSVGGTAGYWPDPHHPHCFPNRCYDPACVDKDVSTWRPWGLEPNPMPLNGSACSGGVGLAGPHGTIQFDGNTTSGATDCTWLIQCARGAVELHFRNFNIGAPAAVMLRDGNNGTHSPVIQVLSGQLASLSASNFSTNSSYMWVSLTSTATALSSAGFAADFTCTPAAPPATCSEVCGFNPGLATIDKIKCNSSRPARSRGVVDWCASEQNCSAVNTTTASGPCCTSAQVCVQPAPAPPLWLQNCDKMVAQASQMGFECSDLVSNFVDMPMNTTLAEVCPVSCGICTPYLGAPGVVVEVDVLAQDVLSGLEVDELAASLAQRINAAGSEIWNNQSLTSREVQISQRHFITDVDFSVTVAKATSEESSATSKAVERTIAHRSGLNLVQAINAVGGNIAGATTSSLVANVGDAALAQALAIKQMRVSAEQSALASDGDGWHVPWNSNHSAVSIEARIDSIQRAYETMQAQRDARAAAGALIAGGSELGANGLTTVQLAAEEAERAAASVLGLDLQPGENIQSGFESFVKDVSRGGDEIPADFAQFGDTSKASVAAAAGAAAAKLLAQGADDAHPLDSLAPILSQAPSSQSFSNDPDLPSSTSRFSAQTKYWWIPDYLPGGRPPEQPDPPVITSYSDHSVRIAWQAPFDWSIPIVGYVVEMRSCEIFESTQSASECDGPRTEYEAVQPVHQGLQTNHEVLGLQAGRMYFFHVRAYNIFDQYMRANNYGVFSYDSLAVTLWRVPDKIDAPIVHRIHCEDPLSSRGPGIKVVDRLDQVAYHTSDAQRLQSKANCSIHLTWVEPFSGAVNNPLVLRPDVERNSIINYRIFYTATPSAPLVHPAPSIYVDQNGTGWLEVPHPPNLRRCETDYSAACPSDWDYSEHVEHGMLVCVHRGNSSMPAGNSSIPCHGTQSFKDYTLNDKQAWESHCNATWARRCEVRTEAVITGLEDTTEYFFIVTAVNRGRPGSNAGFVRDRPAATVYRKSEASVQVWGEGDFSDPSQIVSASVRVGQRVLAQDRLAQLTPPVHEDEESPGLYPGSRVPVRGELPAMSHETENGPVQLEDTWYYPATVTEVQQDLEIFTVTFDQTCVGDTGVIAKCVDARMTRAEIDTLGRGSKPLAAVTWRVADAPAAPTFGTVTESTVEVHWLPPAFDGNTNHEALYADPADSASGGIILGYRLFMARYDDSTGLRENWIELDIAHLGTNTTHVVTNLDSDVVYIFTVVATNIVGDSAHSQEAEGPITLEVPIPQSSVAVTLRPVCPEIQPRSTNSASQWLACTNLPSTLLATTAGGGTNALFDWTLWQEYVEITKVPSVFSTEEVWIQSPVSDANMMRELVLNGYNVTVFDNGTGLHHMLKTKEVLTTNSSQSSAVRREKVLDLGEGGSDCCTLAVPDGDYLLVLNSSNTRGWIITEERITLKKCGCMDIFNSEFDASARHHAPFMCDSHTWEGAEKIAIAGKFNYYEQHLSDSVFAVELSVVVESGNVDVYTSTTGTPQLSDNSWDTMVNNVSAVDHSVIAWEYRVPFNVLLVAPEPGVRGHQNQYIDVPNSLYVGILGADDFSRYSIRARNVKFQEERINLPDWEATNDMVETGRYKFYELYFSESGADMDVKISVQCKVGNVTLFVAKKDKYPSEFRTYLQTATTASQGLAEVIDTWQPEEDRVVFLGVRGNEGGYAEGYPHTPTSVNEFVITARSYRYRAETVQLQPIIVNETATMAGNLSGDAARYSEVALDNFNFFEIKYSDAAYAVQATLSVNYGVVDLYSSFDVPPTQGRHYQRAAGLYGNVTVEIPFDAVGSGVGSVFIGIFGRETDFSNYALSTQELHLHDAHQDPVTLSNGTWLRDLSNSPNDGYRFYRSYVGPEDRPMGHTVRSGPGSRAESPSVDPSTWGTDWQEQWVQTWSEHHRDEYDFDVYATVEVRVRPEPGDASVPSVGPDGQSAARRLASANAGGVSVFASLDWKYPTMQRARDAETHRLGGNDAVTVATLTLPVWTFFGRTLFIGVRTDQPNAPYDIKVSYQVQFEQDLTTPVAKPHKKCPTVPVLMGHHAAGVTLQVACNGHGTCVDGRCHCETGFLGDDCATVTFAEGDGATTRQPRIELLSPAMGDVLSQIPVNLSFAVTNHNIPADGHVLLYVDGRPYPKKHSNMLSTLDDLRVYGLYRGRHTAKIVLVDTHGAVVTADTVHFVVEKGGGCANDCSRRGICMDGPAGQYCICNDGWVGADCAMKDLWRSGQKFYGMGSSLTADLIRQLDHSVMHGMQQSWLEMASLKLSLSNSADAIADRQSAAERAINDFRNRMEDDTNTAKLEHETMLDTLYRNRDRVQLESEQHSEMMKRSVTEQLERRHESVRSLNKNQQRVQNKMDRLRRSHDMRFALMNDEFEYANAKMQSGTSAIRDFDPKVNKISDVARSDCVQTLSGEFECFSEAYEVDTSTGDQVLRNVPTK
eukprot:SAG25_NODE_78_length_16848_cov_6.662189_5_plen_3067_part_00